MGKLNGGSRREWPPMWTRKHPAVVQRAERDRTFRMQVLNAQTPEARRQVVAHAARLEGAST